MATDPTTLSELLEFIRNRPQRDIGLVCVGGPAGSGKTTLAAQIARELHAQTIHMDDLYEGWEGIAQGAHNLNKWILEPLAAGRDGEYQRYDWHLGEFAERHRVPRASWLVVEGCTSATRLVDKHDPFIIWVEADDETRLDRGLERDGEHLRDHWLTFMDTEARIYAENATRDRAHIHLDGFGQITARSM
jgi:uridine kinase